MRMSAKRSFQVLRQNGPYYCSALTVKVKITKLFFYHISSAKRRSFEDIVQRFLIIPFVEDILSRGILIRKKDRIPKAFFRISLNLNPYVLTVIVLKQKEGFVLLSCFVD